MEGKIYVLKNLHVNNQIKKLKPSKTDEKFANIPLDSSIFSWFQAKRDIFHFRQERGGLHFVHI